GDSPVASELQSELGAGGVFEHRLTGEATVELEPAPTVRERAETQVPVLPPQRLPRVRRRAQGLERVRGARGETDAFRPERRQRQTLRQQEGGLGSEGRRAPVSADDGGNSSRAPQLLGRALVLRLDGFVRRAVRAGAGKRG